MNRIEFKKEVLESDLCPENFEKIYNEFCFFQNEAIRTLNEFHRVCEKNGIRYQLAFGSLLGAVRDNGQIPWDYDVDVIVPYQEKENLISALEKDLNPDFYYKCFEKDTTWPSFIMRLAPKKFNTNVLHVDVFYVIGAPSDEFLRQKFEKKMQCYFRMLHLKLRTLKNLMPIKRKIVACLAKLLLLPFSVSYITGAMENICKKYDLAKSKMCICQQGVYRNKAFETKKLWSTRLIETKMGTFRITKNYDYILRIIYKDYETIFPLENRLNEMLMHYNLLAMKNIKIKPTSVKSRYYMDDEDLT